MIAYHVDRTGSLSPGQSIELIEPVPRSSEMAFMIQTLFSGKVSKWGNRLLVRSNDAPQTDLTMANIEQEFELVRRASFPRQPSRYQSFFAVEKLNDLIRWGDLLAEQNARVFAIEYLSEPIRPLDASLLLGSLNDRIFPHTYRPEIGYSNAFKYWSGEMSSNPKPELLIPPPVTVLRQLNVHLCE